jgi:glycosyltransferase involved in cell wall biosynthesis
VKIYWYWPFARQEEIGVLPAVVRPGDELVVHSLARPEGLKAQSGNGWVVRPELPEVQQVREFSPAWFSSRTSTYVRRAAQRRRLERSFQADLTHVMFLNYFTDAVRRREGDRGSAVRVSSVHDAVPHHSRLSPRIQPAVLRRLYEVSGHLVVHHDHVARRLSAEFGVAPERISVVPLQVPDFGDMGRQPMPEERRVLFFGTFRRNKGLDVLLEAIALLRGREDLRFTIAGRGDEELMQRVAAAAKEDSRITVELGFVAPCRKSELYATSRLAVLPYTSFASQSGGLHDSYGHGRPVLVTDVGALGETVREDRSGWVVAPGDPQALAEAIDTTMQDDVETDARGERARAAAATRSPALIGIRLRKLYEDLLNAPT